MGVGEGRKGGEVTSERLSLLPTPAPPPLARLGPPLPPRRPQRDRDTHTRPSSGSDHASFCFSLLLTAFAGLSEAVLSFSRAGPQKGPLVKGGGSPPPRGIGKARPRMVPGEHTITKSGLSFVEETPQGFLPGSRAQRALCELEGGAGEGKEGRRGWVSRRPEGSPTPSAWPPRLRPDKPQTAADLSPLPQRIRRISRLQR